MKTGGACELGLALPVGRTISTLYNELYIQFLAKMFFRYEIAILCF